MATEASSKRMWWLSCLIAWLGLGAVLGIGLQQRASRPILVAEPPGILPDGPSQQIDSRIDPNTVEWHDLTRLPRVGEKLARTIVAYREAKILEWRSDHPDLPAGQAPPVFQRPEDLLPIKGVGPRTLELMRPYLRFGAAGPAPSGP